MQKLNYEDFKNWVYEESTEISNIDSSSFVINYARFLFEKGIYTTRRLRTVQKSKFKAFIEELKNCQIGDIEKDLIDDAIEKVCGNDKNKKVYRSQYKRAIFKYAVDDGLLIESYDRYFMHFKYHRHCELRETIAVAKRDTGWYVCEYLFQKEESGKKVHASELTYLKTGFLKYWSISPSELKEENFQELDFRSKQESRSVLIFLNTHGYSFDLTKLGGKESMESLDFKTDLWKVVEEGGKISKLNFSLYDDNEKYKLYIKKWMLDRIQTNKKGHAKYLNLLGGYFMDYLKERDIKLSSFGNKQKRIWLSWLRENVSNGEFKNGTVRNAVGTVKQFTSYLIESDAKAFKYNLAWVKGKDAIQDKSKRRLAYAKWEIEKMIKALKKDEDRVFVCIETIILLTGRRLSEVLNLKRGCLVDIGPIKCMKFTSSKISRELVIPLPADKANDEGGLFAISPSKMIIEAVDELKEISDGCIDYCEKKDKDRLIIEENKSFNMYGYKASAIKEGKFYSKLYSFKQRNRIEFELESHRFRNTIASKIIRGSGSVEEASRTLSNTPASVARYYESELGKHEIMSKGDIFVIDARENAAKILKQQKVPEVVREDETSEMAAVPGGFCKDGEEAKRSCTFYNRLFGHGGCLGCSQLAVTSENTGYYKELRGNVAVELEKNTGTPFAKSSMSKLRLVDTTIQNIKKVEKVEQ